MIDSDPSSYEEISEHSEQPIQAITIYENPFEDQMEEKRLYLLEYYELMNKCVETNFGLHPRMTSDEAMTECCGTNFRIMVHEFDHTMKRVTEMFETILRHKFSLMGDGYEDEINHFLSTLKDFVNRDFQVKDSIALSIRGAQMIVDGKLYQDLITASEDILQDLEEYRLELKKGRDNILIGIRGLFEKRDEQIEEMLREEEKAAQAALAEEKRKEEERKKNEQAANNFNSSEYSDEDNGSAHFEDSSENSDESGSHESEESGGEHSEDEEEEDEDARGDNFVNLDKDDDSSLESDVDYDAMSSNQKVFDEFRDEDEEKKKINDIHEGQIEEEWDRLKKEQKLDPRLAYVDDDSRLVEKDHSMKTHNL